MGAFQFDLDTAVQPAAPGRFTGELHERWTIMGVPNGGYAMALPLRACQAVSEHPDPVTTTAHFLAPTAPGPADVVTEVVKAGRSTTTVATALVQQGRERIRMLTTLSDLDARSGPTHSFMQPPVLEEPFETERSQLIQQFPSNFDLQIPAKMAGGAFGNPTGNPEMAGRMAFVDGRPPDLISMPVFADGLPPVAFNLGHAAWTPTVELTIHFWRRPAPGPITIWLTTSVVEQGFHDETGDLWDSEGNLVARSRQLALILGG